jgi:hypothetical protein
VKRVLGYEPRCRHRTRGPHPSDDLPAAQEFFAAQTQNPGAKKALDARVRHRDGSWRWL